MNNEKIKVLFIWKVREELKKYLQNGIDNHNIELIFPKEAKEELYLKYAIKVEAIVGWRPTEKLLEKAKNLKLFINPGAGVQHLTELFKKIQQKKDVVLVNGHGNSYFTAEHIVAMLLALLNKIIVHHNWMREGKWRLGDDAAKSIPLRHKRVGLLGYGKVNKKVHRFLSPYDVGFSILRKNWQKDELYEFPTEFNKYNYSQLNTFLAEIDILLIALPLTKETKGMIGKKELGLLGKEGFLVNAGRGPVVQEKALYEALKHKTISAAAIDVWYDYRPKPDKDSKKFPASYPLYELDNILLSPHRAASPLDDLRRWDEVIENIMRLARRENEFLNVVDVKEGY